jgi:hypothetical protein
MVGTAPQARHAPVGGTRRPRTFLFVGTGTIRVSYGLRRPRRTENIESRGNKKNRGEEGTVVRSSRRDQNQHGASSSTGFSSRRGLCAVS